MWKKKEEEGVPRSNSDFFGKKLIYSYFTYNNTSYKRIEKDFCEKG